MSASDWTAGIPASMRGAGTDLRSDPRMDPRGAIARASADTGVDFHLLLAQARIESGMNPQARAHTSSAAGLYQFTRGTWAQMLDRHGEAIGVEGGSHGTGRGGSLLSRLNDPAERARLMALRFDPQASARMAAELAGDNRDALAGALGREPSGNELYLAHFLGADGAVQMIGANASDPTQSAAALLPRAAAANRSIFFDPSGAPRSVGAVMGLVDQKISRALAAEGLDGLGDGAGMAAVSDDGFPVAAPGFGDFPVAHADPGAAPPASGGPIAQEFASARDDGAPAPDGAGPAERPSMAETLRTAFGIANGQDGGEVPDFVRRAYGRLNALGL